MDAPKIDVTCFFHLPKIKKCKDEHPDKIDEVPVETHGFDDLVASLSAGEKASPSAFEIPPPNFSRNDEQENHADRHVSAVEARDQEKARAKLGRAPGVAPRPDPFQD